MADNANGLSAKAIDSGQCLLHLEADEVTTEFKGGAVDVFAVWLVCHAYACEAGMSTGAVGKLGDEYAATVLREAGGERIRIALC